MSRVAMLLVGLLAMAMGAIAYHLRQEPAPPQPRPTASGSYQVLQMNLADADGRPQPFSQWHGKILVVNYWATWCPPCIDEMPGFSRLQKKFSENGVQFVGIGIDTPDKIRHFQESAKIGYPLLIGGMDSITSSVELGNKHQALPFTAIFDRNRKLVSVKLGRWQEADLARELEAMLKP